MKVIKKASIMALTFLGATIGFANTFADSNDYGIVYSGGNNLGSSNVTINQEMVEELTPLIQASGPISSVPNQATKWKKAYMQDGTMGCKDYYYFEVSEANPVVESDGLGFTINSDQYRAEVRFKSVTSADLGAKVTAVGIVPQHDFVYGGWLPRQAGTSETCGDAIAGINGLSANNSDDRIFVNMNIKLYRKGEDKIFTSNQLYFGITDIDAAQSFKILNTGNELTPSNMFAKNAADLQPTDTTLRNKYVANGNYIYSEYEKGGDPYEIATDQISNVFVKLKDSTQTEGLNVVFGFVNSAGSGIEYYAKQYVVDYQAHVGGKITGIETENVVAGHSPIGSSAEPEEGFSFSAWVANKDVTLDDGKTTIKEGEVITAEQIKRVVVNSDITFTAMFEEEDAPAVPDTGASTKDTSVAQVVTISLLGVLSAALIIRAIPFMLHKKVKFN